MYTQAQRLNDSWANEIIEYSNEYMKEMRTVVLEWVDDVTKEECEAEFGGLSYWFAQVHENYEPKIDCGDTDGFFGNEVKSLAEWFGYYQWKYESEI